MATGKSSKSTIMAMVKTRAKTMAAAITADGNSGEVEWNEFVWKKGGVSRYEKHIQKYGKRF